MAGNVYDEKVFQSGRNGVTDDDRTRMLMLCFFFPTLPCHDGFPSPRTDAPPPPPRSKHVYRGCVSGPLSVSRALSVSQRLPPLPPTPRPLRQRPRWAASPAPGPSACAAVLEQQHRLHPLEATSPRPPLPVRPGWRTDAGPGGCGTGEPAVVRSASACLAPVLYA